MLAANKVFSQRLLLAILLSTFGQTVNAQHYRATKLIPNFFESIEHVDRVASISSDKSSLMAFANGPGGVDLYTYNFQDKTLNKLLAIGLDPTVVEFWSSLSIYSRLVSFDNRTLINTGKLHISDGTVEGTSLIGDFGVGAVGGSPGQFYFPYAHNIQTAGKTFFFSVGNKPNLDKLAIWQSDGTAKNTFEMAIPETQEYDRFIILPDSAQDNGTAIAYGRSPDKGHSFLRLVAGSNQAEFLTAFDGDINRDLEIHDGHTVRAGYVFCRQERTEDDSVNSLWRLSKDGSLTRLAEACNNIYPIGQDRQEFAFSSSDGRLWKSNGSTNGTQEIEIDNVEWNAAPLEFSRFNNVCSTQENTFIQVRQTSNNYKGGILSISGQSDKASVIDNATLEACTKEHVVFIIEGERRRSGFVLNTKTSETIPISGPNSGGLDIIGGGLVNELNDRFFVSTVEFTLKNGIYTGFLPAITELLENE